MIQPVVFGPDVHFLIQAQKCVCSRPSILTQVVISLRLKELIEGKEWSHLCAEDVEEIRALRELGFLVEHPP